MQAGSRLLRRIAGCQRGATALEFAFALPIMLMLILGMLEIAMVMFVSISVEGGLREAARFGITGQAPESGTREDAILAIIDRYTFGVVDLDASNVSFMTYDSFTDVGQPEPFTDANGNGSYDVGETFEDLNGNAQWDPDRGAAGVGNAGSVVLYEVDYEWELLTPYLSALLGDDGVFHMSASIAVRNEPYGVTGGS
jgi:Flp pilus assembly protein TadG